MIGSSGRRLCGQSVAAPSLIAYRLEISVGFWPSTQFDAIFRKIRILGRSRRILAFEPSNRVGATRRVPRKTKREKSFGAGRNSVPVSAISGRVARRHRLPTGDRNANKGKSSCRGYLHSPRPQKRKLALMGRGRRNPSLCFAGSFFGGFADCQTVTGRSALFQRTPS